jgi:hypothetical protein
MAQQRALVGAKEPQQIANNQHATRKQTDCNQKATSSWSNITQTIPQHIPKHIPQHLPQQIAFVGAQQPQQRPNNQKANKKKPESNQQQAIYSTTYPRKYYRTYTTAKSIRRTTIHAAKSKQQESNPKATSKPRAAGQISHDIFRNIFHKI